MTSTIDTTDLNQTSKALADAFTDEDNLTELERANAAVARFDATFETLDISISLTEMQSARLSRVCRDRRVEPQEFFQKLLDSYLSANIGAPLITKPRLNSTTVETQVEPVIQKVTGVSPQRQIYSIVDGQERH